MTIEDFASQISLTLITTLNLPKTKCPAAKVSQGFISQNQDIHKIAPPSDVQLRKSISSSLLAVTNNLSPLVHYYEWLQREQHCHYTLTYNGTPSICIIDKMHSTAIYCTTIITKQSILLNPWINFTKWMSIEICLLSFGNSFCCNGNDSIGVDKHALCLVVVIEQRNKRVFCAE